jgi:SAM-dependent methyltransferase
LAVVFHEALARIAPPKKLAVRIFATDLNREALAIARRGWYPADVAGALTPARLRRFFVAERNGWRATAELRGPVAFMVHNMVGDRPLAQMDLVVCRNLLIYLDPRLQKALLAMFWQALNPGGFLFLGRAESTGGARKLFTPFHRQAKLYQRIETGAVDRFGPFAPPAEQLPHRLGASSVFDAPPAANAPEAPEPESPLGPFGANDAAVVRIQGGRALPGSPRPATRVFPIRSDRGHHPNFEFAAEAAYPELAADVQLAFANRQPVEREFDGPDGRQLRLTAETARGPYDMCIALPCGVLPQPVDLTIANDVLSTRLTKVAWRQP